MAMAKLLAVLMGDRITPDRAFVPSAVQGWVRRWLAELRAAGARASPTPTSSASARRNLGVDVGRAGALPGEGPPRDAGGPLAMSGHDGRALGRPPVGQVSPPFRELFHSF